MSKIVIAELDIDVQAMLTSTSQVKKSIDDLKKSQKLLTDSGDTSSKSFVENAGNLKVLNAEYTAGVKALADNTKAVSEQANRVSMLDLALKGEVSSIAEARAQNTLLNKLRNEAKTTLGEQSQEVVDLNAKLDQNNDFIKANSDEYLKQKINIGNYSESMRDALSNLNPLNGGLSGFVERSKAAGGAGNLVKSSLGGMAMGFLGVAKASIAFIATPIGAFIAALVLVFASVKAAMDRSAESTAKITKIFSVFSGIANILLKAISVLGDYWINSYVKILDKVGVATEKVMKGISSTLKALGFDQASKSVDNFTNSTKASIKASQDLAAAEAKLEIEQRKANRTQLEYQKDAEKLRQIRDDETKTIEQRIKANEDLGAVLKLQLKAELVIAQLALDVANARLKQEGKTKNTLDQQGVALDKIADIQERITGQESEQIVNKVSLQRDAATKEKEIRDKATAEREAAVDKAISKSKTELDLFIANQGIKAKSLDDELKLAEQVRDKKLAILKTELEKGKITQSEYNLQSLTEKQSFLQKQSEVTVANADQELKNFIDANKSKLDATKFLSAEMVNDEISRLGSIGTAQLEAERIRFESGLINKQAYEDAIKAIDAKTAEDQQAVIDAKLAIDLDKKLIDEENKIAANQNEFDQRQLDLDRAKKQELDAAEGNGAAIKIINEKYANFQKQLDQSVQTTKLQAISQTLGMAASMFKEHTLAYKALSIAQITIDTILSAQAAYKSTVGIPIIGPTLAPIAAGIAYASGAMNVAKVAGVKFEKGGIQEVGGNRHTQGGTKFYGEDGTTFEAEQGEGIGVLNRGAFASFMDFNNNHSSGGRSTPTFMAGGGIITQGVQSQSSGLNAEDILSIVRSMPAPQVAVTDIHAAAGDYVRVVNGADY